MGCLKLIPEFFLTDEKSVSGILKVDGKSCAGVKEVYFDDFKVTHTKSPVIQSDDYYPFGMVAQSYQRESSLPNDYKYNGKEEQTELGLGWLDYGARMYQPELGRFFTQDRFADKYFGYSPYGYAASNPIAFIDINGDSLWINTGSRNLLYQDGKLYNKRGKEVKKGLTGRGGGNSFVGRAVRALGSLSETEEGGSVINTLQSSKFHYTITQYSGDNRFAPGEEGTNADGQKYRNNAEAIPLMNGAEGVGIPGFAFNNVGSGGLILWDPSMAGLGSNDGAYGSTLNLIHEMRHAADASTGQLDGSVINYDGIVSWRREIRAVYTENMVRQQRGMNSIRGSYGGTSMLKNGNPVNAPLPELNRNLQQLLYHDN